MANISLGSTYEGLIHVSTHPYLSKPRTTSHFGVVREQTYCHVISLLSEAMEAKSVIRSIFALGLFSFFIYKVEMLGAYILQHELDHTFVLPLIKSS